MYTQDDKIQAGIRRQMINERTIQPMGRTYGNMSMGQGKPNWVADRRPVQQGLKSIDIGMAPSTYTIDPNMMHAAKMQRMNRGNMNNYPMINRITDKLSSGLGTLRDTVTNTTTGFYDTIGEGIQSILDNTFLGRIAAARDATNPRAGNYNPRLQGQIDYLKGQGLYGVSPNTGLNQITGGVLQGKNLQSMFGSNDLATMYEKELVRANKVLENLPNQWSRLATSDDPEDIARWNKKLAWHRNKVAKIKQEQAAAAAAAKAAADQRAAAIQKTQGGIDRSETNINKATEQGIAINKNEGVGSVNPHSAYGKAQGYTGGHHNPHTQTGWSGSTQKKAQGGIVSLWRR